MSNSSNGPDEPEMHRQVSWMVAADALILEFLYSTRDRRGRPAIQTPRTIHLNTGYSRQHASGRCKVLVEYGLVEQTGEGEYRLTDFGEQVMADEIPLEELDELEPTDDQDVDEE
ncbi:hypothetical protein [Natrinema salsiterrestre]|uniref:Phage PhiH1 repressor protein n=1 Tax=Natrinema salsiterrestre TaxID=2950540 RepID=A0A9Q4L8C4_9EURY|nr:hypothetical protein [Natrinema salsiterrestre]MDF9748407.1 hypothetical protein [Natrinema salsiterrestre]